jgi:hypothetical protein
MPTESGGDHFELAFQFENEKGIFELCFVTEGGIEIVRYSPM